MLNVRLFVRTNVKTPHSCVFGDFPRGLMEVGDVWMVVPRLQEQPGALQHVTIICTLQRGSFRCSKVLIGWKGQKIASGVLNGPHDPTHYDHFPIALPPLFYTFRLAWKVIWYPIHDLLEKLLTYYYVHVVIQVVYNLKSDYRWTIL